MSAPVLYLPHGGGPMPLLHDPAHAGLTRFLSSFTKAFARPCAIVLVSAHWEARLPSVNAAAAPALLFDYAGFPPESYRLRYPAPGHPQLAAEIAGLLEQGGFECTQEPARGYDHGMFVPLMLMYPEADIPCVQLSLVRGLDPDVHLRLGACLAGLPERNIAVIGSGMSFHNLQVLFAGDQPALRQASDSFDAWLVDTLTAPDHNAAQRSSALCDWAQAPYGRFCHPREEHLLPLHVCVGAAGNRAATLIFNEPLMGHKVSGFGWF